MCTLAQPILAQSMIATTISSMSSCKVVEHIAHTSLESDATAVDCAYMSFSANCLLRCKRGPGMYTTQLVAAQPRSGTSIRIFLLIGGCAATVEWAPYRAHVS